MFAEGKWVPFNPTGVRLRDKVREVATSLPNHREVRGLDEKTLEEYQVDEDFRAPRDQISEMISPGTVLVDLCCASGLNGKRPKGKGRSRRNCMYKTSWNRLRHKSKPKLADNDKLWTCRRHQLELIVHKARRDRAEMVLTVPHDERSTSSVVNTSWLSVDARERTPLVNARRIRCLQRSRRLARPHVEQR